jgi:tripartite-type tricarboxylate transporter receptor subunit TctC
VDRTKLSRRALAALAAPLLMPAGAWAQAPDGPITIVVPYTPGTGPDILARLVAPVLQARLGQAVVVENRAGASGNIGTQAVAIAPPDGYTLTLATTQIAVLPDRICW